MFTSRWLNKRLLLQNAQEEMNEWLNGWKWLWEFPACSSILSCQAIAQTLEFLLSWIETMTNFTLTHWQRSILPSEICYRLSTWTKMLSLWIYSFLAASLYWMAYTNIGGHFSWYLVFIEGLNEIMMILIKILTFEIFFPLSMELEYEPFCKTSSIITEKYLEAPQTYFSDKENRRVMQKNAPL